MIPLKQFESWLRHQLFVNVDDGHCQKIVVKDVTGSSKIGSNIISIDVPADLNGDNADDWIKDNIKLIEETTGADAAGKGGTQTYVIMAYHETLDKSSARFTIRMQGDPNLEDDDVGSEPATKSGLLGQVMRHNEAIMRTAALQTATIMTQLQRTTQQQASIIEKLIEEKFNNIDVVEQLLSQKSERDIEVMKASRELEMKERALDTFKQIVPLAASKLLGPKTTDAAPGPISDTDTQLGALADSISMDQLNALQQVFTPAQLMQFMDVFTKVKEKQEANKKSEDNK